MTTFFSKYFFYAFNLSTWVDIFKAVLAGVVGSLEKVNTERKHKTASTQQLG